MKKTNAMRLLESLNIEYETKEYQTDNNALDAVSIAKAIDIPPSLVYKTIVMKGNSGTLYVFVTPSEFEIKTKKACQITQEKDIALLETSQLLKHTGYIRGGCSPLGMIHKYKTFISELALLEEKIHVSAGKIGQQIYLRVDDLARAADASFEDFV